MHLAYKGIIPPLEWQHNKLLENIYGDTVAIILLEKGIEVPE